MQACGWPPTHWPLQAWAQHPRRGLVSRTGQGFGKTMGGGDPGELNPYLESLGRKANSGSLRQQEQNPGPLHQWSLDGPSFGPGLQLAALFGCQRQAIDLPHPILSIVEMLRMESPGPSRPMGGRPATCLHVEGRLPIGREARRASASAASRAWAESVGALTRSARSASSAPLCFLCVYSFLPGLARALGWARRRLRISASRSGSRCFRHYVRPTLVGFAVQVGPAPLFPHEPAALPVQHALAVDQQLGMEGHLAGVVARAAGLGA